MFQNIKFLACLLMVLFTLQSCEKDLLETNSSTQVSSNELASTDLNVTVEKGMLSFDSSEEYETAVDYLSTLSSEKVIDFTQRLGFVSLEQTYTEQNTPESEREIDDVLFASLLSPDHTVKIGKDVYLVDMEMETVYKLVGGDLSLLPALKEKKAVKGQIELYSTEEDILNPDGGNQISNQKATYCDAYSTGWYPLGYCGNYYQARTRYFKAGIYFSLTSTYKRGSNSCYDHEMTVDVSGSCENRKQTINFDTYDIGSNNVKVKVYSSTRRLKKINMSTYFLLRNAYGHEVDSAYADIDC